MLNKAATQEASVSVHRRQTGDYLVALAFFAAAGTAMIAWIVAIAWISWCFLEWILS
ncbi:hypothetical protein [Bradyrhizobium sp. BR 10289]|uniref:hypothetical protein n=1 Tax=Bradyrhizobium sp. BR 10289 TaxID=2749993 RepID=UPI001C6489DD|nr:hypothetical protein [Bradyrhizobium sp. BR 10289]MBW7972595.1 hypothetical protein [Bradyrhizobium sp. BR 10289]